MRPLWRIAAVATVAAVVMMIVLIVGQPANPPPASNSVALTTTHQVQIAIVPTLTASNTQLVAPTATPPTPTFTVVAPAVNTTSYSPSISSTPSSVPIFTPSATFSPTPSTTPTPTGTNDVIVILEGPVTDIGDSSLTINGFTVQVDPQNPILPLLDVGDNVHVEGTLDANGRIAAEMVSNNSDTTVVSGSPATVSLDGPVQSISGNHLVVNSVPVQLAPNDPLAGKLKTGDFVHVQGNFQGTGATTILVIANITIINNVVVNGTPTCRYDVDAMGMGHWHCNDGMGMGDDGMGPPVPPGMGDDGMGPPAPAMGMGPGG